VSRWGNRAGDLCQTASLACKYTTFGLPFEVSIAEARYYFYEHELDYAAGYMQVSNAGSYRFRLQV
jgi:hypothetical protein